MEYWNVGRLGRWQRVSGYRCSEKKIVGYYAWQIFLIILAGCALWRESCLPDELYGGNLYFFSLFIVHCFLSLSCLSRQGAFVAEYLLFNLR